MSRASTSEVIVGCDHEVAQWAAQGLELDDFGDCSALGILRNGQLIGGVVYHIYRHPNIEMAIYTTSPKWATRSTLYHIFHYPFNLLGCSRVTALVDADNHKSISLVGRLGYQLEGILREARPHCDQLIYGMTKRECRWIHGKEIGTKTARPVQDGRGAVHLWQEGAGGFAH